MITHNLDEFLSESNYDVLMSLIKDRASTIIRLDPLCSQYSLVLFVNQKKIKLAVDFEECSEHRFSSIEKMSFGNMFLYSFSSTEHELDMQLREILGPILFSLLV